MLAIWVWVCTYCMRESDICLLSGYIGLKLCSLTVQSKSEAYTGILKTRYVTEQTNCQCSIRACFRHPTELQFQTIMAKVRYFLIMVWQGWVSFSHTHTHSLAPPPTHTHTPRLADLLQHIPLYAIILHNQPQPTRTHRHVCACHCTERPSRGWRRWELTVKPSSGENDTECHCAGVNTTAAASRVNDPSEEIIWTYVAYRILKDKSTTIWWLLRQALCQRFELC